MILYFPKVESHGVMVCTLTWCIRGLGIKSYNSLFFSSFASFLGYLYIFFRVSPFIILATFPTL